MYSSSAFSPKRLFQRGYNSQLTGSVMTVANGTKGAISFFTRTYEDGSSTIRYFFSGSSSSVAKFSLKTDANEYLVVRLSDGTNFLEGTSTTYQLLAVNAEAHLAIEWDTGFAAGLKKLRVWVNKVEIALTIKDESPSFTIPYAALTWLMGFESEFSIRELALWANTVPTFPQDLSALASDALQPVDIGKGGEYLTARPDLYLSLRGAAPVKSFATNRGKSGGTWAFSTSVVFHDRMRIVGYGDSNMAGAGASSYTSKLGALVTPPIPVLNVGVLSASLAAIYGYMLTGHTSLTPRRSAAVTNLPYLKANFPDTIFVIEGGGNSLPDDASTWTFTELKAFWASIFTRLHAYFPDARYIVQGMTTRVTSETGTYAGTSLAAQNAYLAETHGARYFEADLYLRSPQAFIDAGLSETAQDLTDRANGIVPDSFRGDDKHLNQAAHNVLLPRAFALMQSLGYF